jgi:hypothetical protein
VRAQIDIKSWLNGVLYRRPDLHKVFAQFHKAGGDVEYLLFLSQWLVLGDVLCRGPTAAPEFVKQVISTRIPDIPAWLQSPPDPPRSLQEALSERIGDSLRYLEWGDYPRRVQRGIELLRRDLEAVFEKNAMAAIFLEYVIPAELAPRKGRRSDVWGSFFLLATTEHLRQNGTKPHYRLCHQVLRSVRKSTKPIKNPTQSVATRVKLLKNAHPHWSRALKILESEYLRQPRKVK